MIKLSDKRLKKLGRTELLQLLVKQGEQLDQTRAALEAANERAAYQERIARLAEKAVSRLSGILEAAQLAQDQYVAALGQLKSQMGLNVVDKAGNKGDDAQTEGGADLGFELNSARRSKQDQLSDTEAFMQELEDQINAGIPAVVDEDFESMPPRVIDEDVLLEDETEIIPDESDTVIPEIAYTSATPQEVAAYQSAPAASMFGYADQMFAADPMGEAGRRDIPMPAPAAEALTYTDIYGAPAETFDDASLRGAKHSVFSVPANQSVSREVAREGIDHGQR